MKFIKFIINNLKSFTIINSSVDYMEHINKSKSIEEALISDLNKVNQDFNKIYKELTFYKLEN